ncbi:unnamed protein product [Choristocarpus tenellus]
MNKIVYPVSGGMEDWGYAGSWDGGVLECTPDTYGGYNTTQTRYNSGTLRALTILVEASDRKSPKKNTLGTREDLFNPASTGNGHIARNIRLTLMMIDLLQPYVEWRGQEEEMLSLDGDNGVDVEWAVGGSFHVDKTQVVWGLWPQGLEDDTIGSPELLSEKLVTVGMATSDAQCGPVLTGDGRWGGEGAQTKTLGPSFKGRVELGIPVGWNSLKGKKVDVSQLNKGKKVEEFVVFVVAVAEVDKDWADQELKAFPGRPPQSHLVNARTNQDWDETNAGHRVRGRLQWYSRPLKLVVKGCVLRGNCSVEEAKQSGTDRGKPIVEVEVAVEEGAGGP